MDGGHPELGLFIIIWFLGQIFKKKLVQDPGLAAEPGSFYDRALRLTGAKTDSH